MVMLHCIELQAMLHYKVNSLQAHIDSQVLGEHVEHKETSWLIKQRSLIRSQQVLAKSYASSLVTN